MPARAVDTVVRGGKVVTATEVLDTSVAIQGGRIVALGYDEALRRRPSAPSMPPGSTCCPA